MTEVMSEETKIDPSKINLRHITEPKCPVVLLLDTSGSMEKDKKIDKLKEGISLLIENLKNDDIARKRVEICAITFGDAIKVVHEFSSVSEFGELPLNAGGYTLMGSAITTGISKIDERKAQYRKFGVDYYRPWIWMITDGEPTDMGPRDGSYVESINDSGTGRSLSNDEIAPPFFALWESVISKVHEGENERKFVFFAIGVQDANMETLSKISVRAPVKLKGLDFKAMFTWLSKSLSSQSRAGTNEQVTLDSPDEWGTIEPS